MSSEARDRLGDAWPPVLNVRQAAAVLRISEALVRDEIRRGNIRALRFGRVLRIPKQSLLRLLEEPGRGESELESRGRGLPDGRISGNRS